MLKVTASRGAVPGYPILMKILRRIAKTLFALPGPKTGSAVRAAEHPAPARLPPPPPVLPSEDDDYRRAAYN